MTSRNRQIVASPAGIPVGAAYARHPEGAPAFNSTGGTSSVFPVLVTKDGGASGDESSECTWTYTVKQLDDETVLATAMTPQVPRLHYVGYYYAGELRPAPFAYTSRYGLACYNGPTLILLVCFGEIGKDGGC